jgi:hypothetical protein
MSRPRDVYLHLLLALALGMVLTEDVLGWSWLPLVFPATGILFAASAAVMSGALDRARSARVFYRRAGLRVLAPFWIVASVLLPVLLAQGWHADDALGSGRLTVGTAWRWVLPLADPPVSTGGLGAATGVWFVRATLWFVLLTPPLLWIFRRWPVRLIVVPVGTLLLMTVGLVNLTGATADIVTGLTTYVCCWLLGFGYGDGLLTRLPLGPTLAGGAAAVAAGLWCAGALRTQYEADSILDIPLASLLVSTGAVLVLLRLQPAFGWLARLRRSAAALRWISRRTVSVVLWAGLTAAVAPTVLDRVVQPRIDVPEASFPLAEALTAGVLLALAVLLVGWIEALLATPGPALSRARRLRRRLRRPVRHGLRAFRRPAVAGRTFVLEDNVVLEEAPRSDVAP